MTDPRPIYDSKLKNNKPDMEVDLENGRALLFYSGSYCNPCKQITPYFKELKSIYPQVKFYKLDVGKNRESSDMFDITVLPTFVLIKDGIVIKKITGARKELLKSSISELCKL